MALLPSEFNSEGVDDMGDFTPIPAGDYVVQIVESELKPTKKAIEAKGDDDQLPLDQYSGLRLNLQFKVMGGEHDGRVIYNGLNIKNPNAQAVEISQKELATICRAVGLVAVTDSAELHMKPMEIKVGVKAATAQYDAQNTIKGYKACTGAIPSSPAADESTSSNPEKKGKKLFEEDED